MVSLIQKVKTISLALAHIHFNKICLNYQIDGYFFRGESAVLFTMCPSVKDSVFASLTFTLSVCAPVYMYIACNMLLQYPWTRDSKINDGCVTKQQRHLLSEDTISDCITSDVLMETKELIGFSYTRFEALPRSAVDTRDSEKEHKERRGKFDYIFRHRTWGVGQDVTSAGAMASGPGSTLYYAQEATATLHVVIDNIKRKFGLDKVRLLDVPCGDFQWMFRFLQTRDDVIYTGVDIVPDLITRHSERFRAHPSWRFILHDAVQHRLNESYDLILVRHLLQHLTNIDVMQLLSHMSTAGNRYLLATTFPSTASNIDLTFKQTGGFRRANLQIKPLSLAPPLCFHKDGPRVDGGFLALWKLPLKQIMDCYRMQYTIKGSHFYTCI